MLSLYLDFSKQFIRGLTSISKYSVMVFYFKIIFHHGVVWGFFLVPMYHELHPSNIVWLHTQTRFDGSKPSTLTLPHCSTKRECESTTFSLFYPISPFYLLTALVVLCICWKTGHTVGFSKSSQLQNIKRNQNKGAARQLQKYFPK